MAISPHVRTVKTASGATAVQIVYSFRQGSRDLEHVGSAHDEVELKLLLAPSSPTGRSGPSVSDG